jgi:hypothetical protein
MGPDNNVRPPVEDPQGEEFKTHQLDPKTTRAMFSLPCGLVWDGALLRDVQVKEMTGVEEEILAGKGPVGDRLNRVITNCLVDVGGVPASHQMVMDLSMIDRLYLLIAIRRISLGDMYTVKATCPMDDCGAQHDYAIDLGKLPVQEMPDPRVRSFQGTLPSGVQFRWHVMTGNDEAWVAAAHKKLKGEGPLTIAILARLDELGGVVLDKEPVRMRSAVAAVGKLSLRDRNYLRSLFRSLEGDLDMDLDFECQTCHAEFSSELEVNAKDFFFPST